MKLVRATFVITLAICLVGGLLFVLGQAVGIVAGQGAWLVTMNATVKNPIVVSSAICAICGFLLTYAAGAPAEPDGH